MFAIAELTVRKLKEPAFFLMLVFCFVIGIFSAGVGDLSEELTGSIVSKIINTGYGYPILTSTFFILLISILMSVFIGATDVPRDIETGLIMLLLAKPISKNQYLMGKFLGILCLCAIFFFGSEITIFITYYVNHGSPYPVGVMLRQLLLFFALLPVISLTVMVSCFVADYSAMIITSIYLIFALPVSLIPILIQLIPKSYGIDLYILKFRMVFFQVIYYFFPNFIYFFQSCSSFSVITLALVLYSFSISVIFMSIALYRIERRDLS